MATFLLYAIGLYVGTGIFISLVFVIFGAARVLPVPVSMSLGARGLVLPGAAALWPYVLGRWLKSCKRP